MIPMAIKKGMRAMALITMEWTICLRSLDMRRRSMKEGSRKGMHRKMNKPRW